MCKHEYPKTKGDKVCQKCGHVVCKTEIYSRVVGYLRPREAYNDSQYQQALDRKYFDKTGDLYGKKVAKENFN